MRLAETCRREPAPPSGPPLGPGLQRLPRGAAPTVATSGTHGRRPRSGSGDHGRGGTAAVVAVTRSSDRRGGDRPRRGRCRGRHCALRRRGKRAPPPPRGQGQRPELRPGRPPPAPRPLPTTGKAFSSSRASVTATSTSTHRRSTRAAACCSRPARPTRAGLDSPRTARQIVYYGNEGGDFEIYVMDSDGGNVTQLTDNDVADLYPSWSRDGTKIAFTEEVDGDAEVFAMNADGSEQTQLTENDPSKWAATRLGSRRD